MNLKIGMNHFNVPHDPFIKKYTQKDSNYESNGWKASF